jgi:hypothetical protein
MSFRTQRLARLMTMADKAAIEDRRRRSMEHLEAASAATE